MKGDENKMKFLPYLLIIFSAFSHSNKIWAQDFRGSIKHDSSFISAQVTGLQTWENIAAFWSLSPAQLRSSNPGLADDSLIGNREILIPLSGILRNTNCDSCRAVYHMVGPSQGLYRIGKWYGNQSAANIKKINNLRSDALTPGQQLLVGYIAMSPSAKVVTVLASNTTPEPVKDTVTLPVKDVEVLPMVSVAPSHELKYDGKGYFEAEWKPNGVINIKTGKAAMFKTESGWQDGKFYLLTSQLMTGAIVKITNFLTGKTIFAKVVGPLPVIKQNEGLQMRISAAAAAALGFWNETDKFELKVEY